VNEGEAVTETVCDAKSTKPRAFEARITNVLLPVVVAVPETTPVEVFRLRPAGSEPLCTEKVGAG
jgi:hypothetical protein